MKKMKKTYLYISLLCLMTGIYSCDYISYPLEIVVEPVDTATCPVVTFPENPNPYRKVLLEDYTGHQCTACPQAAIKAAELEDQFHDSLIIVAVHVSYFANPSPPDYPENFKTTAGDAYNLKFAFGGWPNGLVNRKDFPAGKQVKPFGNWGAEISGVLKTPVEADLQMDSYFNPKDSTVCISVQAKFLSMSLPSSDYKLCLFLLQDSIIAPQLDNGVYKPTYLHRHMLRDNINGTWGDSLLSGSVIPSAIRHKYRYKIKKNYKGVVCKPKNCYLVAFIYDNKTLRILQAEEVKVIK
jgi:hypothetical protein